MKIIYAVILALFSTFLLSGCSKDKLDITPDEKPLSDVVSSFGYEVIDLDPAKTYVELEGQDRSFYKPVSFESARIRSLKPLDAYHGPVLGNYYLSIEKYHTQAEARKRAEEYQDLSRLAAATKYDEHDLSKMTVRCWGFSSGDRAYLLTTHAAMYYAQERKINSVIDGVKAYENK